MSIDAPAGRLAIDGGAPVRTSFLPFHQPSMGREEEAEVLDTLRSGWLTTGPKTQRFEAEFARYLGASRALGVTSCTAAMHLGLVALGIGSLIRKTAGAISAVVAMIFVLPALASFRPKRAPSTVAPIEIAV